MSLEEWVGLPVVVEWVNTNDDWYWFKILAVDRPMILFQGIDSPYGDHHAGDTFWANADSIISIALDGRSK